MILEKLFPPISTVKLKLTYLISYKSAETNKRRYHRKTIVEEFESWEKGEEYLRKRVEAIKNDIDANGNYVTLYTTEIRYAQ